MSTLLIVVLLAVVQFVGMIVAAFCMKIYYGSERQLNTDDHFCILFWWLVAPIWGFMLAIMIACELSSIIAEKVIQKAVATKSEA